MRRFAPERLRSSDERGIVLVLTVGTIVFLTIVLAAVVDYTT
jgi:hypothetical protein